jgi:hypothetical protein
MPRSFTSADHYAYHAEAALAHYAQALWLRHDGLHCERLACALYAKAGRGALAALCAARALPFDEATFSLLAAVICLEDQGRAFGRQFDKALGHAQRLSRVLILDQRDAGAGYVTRDLFDADEVECCQHAAAFFMDACCRRLLRATLEQALLRLAPFRQPPLTDTTLWQRRGPAGRGTRSVP